MKVPNMLETIGSYLWKLDLDENLYAERWLRRRIDCIDKDLSLNPPDTFARVLKVERTRCFDLLAVLPRYLCGDRVRVAMKDGSPAPEGAVKKYTVSPQEPDTLLYVVDLDSGRTTTVREGRLMPV